VNRSSGSGGTRAKRWGREVVCEGGQGEKVKVGDWGLKAGGVEVGDCRAEAVGECAVGVGAGGVEPVSSAGLDVVGAGVVGLDVGEACCAVGAGVEGVDAVGSRG